MFVKQKEGGRGGGGMEGEDEWEGGENGDLWEQAKKELI